MHVLGPGEEHLPGPVRIFGPVQRACMCPSSLRICARDVPKHSLFDPQEGVHELGEWTTVLAPVGSGPMSPHEPKPTDTGPAGPFSRYEVAMPARALPVTRRTTGARA